MKHKANDQNLIYTEGNQNGCKNINPWPGGQSPVLLPRTGIHIIVRGSGRPDFQP